MWTLSHFDIYGNEEKKDHMPSKRRQFANSTNFLCFCHRLVHIWVISQTILYLYYNRKNGLGS